MSLDNWDLAPFNRWTFRNVRRVLPTAAVRRGEGPVSPLEAAPRDLDVLSFETADGGQSTIGEFLETTFSESSAHGACSLGRSFKQQGKRAVVGHCCEL